MFKIPYGISNFGMIRSKKDNYLYIDKTRFIREVEKTKYLLHLRPRRFGKSLFLSMLDSYYDVASTESFDKLFSGLYIYDNPTETRNSYYILRFNFSGIQNVKPDDLEEGFVRKVKEGVDAFVKRYELNIELNKTFTAAGILGSLLNKFSSLKLNHKIYILIDEYDHFTNSLLSGNGAEFLSILKRGGFVRSFYEVIKENAELGTVERLFMTGVMSITLDSMTSGFNIATNITTHPDFADMMGFTSEEVKDILDLPFSKLDQTQEATILTTDEQNEVYEIFRDNYNGYLFSSRGLNKVFNSTLVMYYLQNYLPKKHSPESLVDTNLNQSSSTIESIVGLKNRESNYKIIENIVNDKIVRATIQPFIDIDKKFDKNDLVTLLFNIGLLTIKEPGFAVRFEIPNKIIESIYLQYLGDLLQKKNNYKVDLSRQETALEEIGEYGKIDSLTALVSEFLLHTSPRNAIGFDEKHIKQIYKILLTFTNQFIVYDEFPSLQGFNDILILKAPNSYAKYEVIIELKYIKKGDATEVKIEKELASGIDQIHDYMKDERLANRENFKKFVVVFVGFEPVRLVEL